MFSYLDNFISGLRKKSYSESNSGTEQAKNTSEGFSGEELGESTEVEISSQSEDSCKTICSGLNSNPNTSSYSSGRRKNQTSTPPHKFSSKHNDSNNPIKQRKSLSCSKRKSNDSKSFRKKSPGNGLCINNESSSASSTQNSTTDKSLPNLRSCPQIFLDHQDSDTDGFDGVNDCDQDDDPGVDLFGGSRRSSSTSTGTGISNDDTWAVEELELDSKPSTRQGHSVNQSMTSSPVHATKPNNYAVSKHHRRPLAKQDTDSGDESDRFFDCEDGSEITTGGGKSGNGSHLRQRLLEHNSDCRESFSENETTSPQAALKCKDSLTSSSPCDTKTSENLLLRNQRDLSGSQTSLTNPTAIEIHSSTFTVPVGGASSSSSSAFMAKTYSSSYKVLSFDQFHKLDQLMNTFIEIHGQGTFPNIKVTLKEFVVSLKSQLRKENVPVESIRLNGGAASHVVGARQMIDDIGYNDLDLIFTLGSDQEMVFDKVRQRLYATLRNLLPQDEDSQVDNLSDAIIDDGYVQKMVKVSNNNDCWSLISLYNNDGENVEVKFVHRMKRQYEFSVDSFQIELDSLLSYYESNSDKSVTFTDNFFLTVMAESKYGKFDEALFHLNNKLVATLRPEEIRGGGLLKYCNLLLNGYHIADSDIKNMQRYMCSRFFIDFPDANSQQNKLQSYIRTHLKKAPKSLRGHLSKQNAGSSNGQSGLSETTSTVSSSEDKENVNECNNAVPQQVLKEKEKIDDGSLEVYRINFLKIVRNVIDYSTVCLMNIERACTLNLLDSMIYDLYRSFVLKREGKFPFEGNDSGYFGSENSSISNSLPSPSHFSRSSSPSNFSINGATASTASRSSSPASIAFAVSASRLQTPVDLALTSNGFLHSTAMGIHFTTPQVFHPFANLHNVPIMQNSGNLSSSRNTVGTGHHAMGGFGGGISSGQHHNQSQLHNHCQQNSLTSHNGGVGSQYQANSGSASSAAHQNEHQAMSSSHFQHHGHSHHSHHGNRSGRNKGGMNNHQYGHYNHYKNGGGSSSNNSNGANMHHHYHHSNNHQYHNYHINSNHFSSHAGSSHYYGGGAGSGGRGNNSYYHSQYNYHSHSHPYSAGTGAGAYQVLGYHNLQYQQQHHNHTQNNNHLNHFQQEEGDPNIVTTNSSSSGGFSALEPRSEKSRNVADDANTEELFADDVDSFYQLTDQCSTSLDEETSPDDEFAQVSSHGAETPPNFCQKGAAKYGPETTTPLALAAF